MAPGIATRSILTTRNKDATNGAFDSLQDVRRQLITLMDRHLAQKPSCLSFQIATVLADGVTVSHNISRSLGVSDCCPIFFASSFSPFGDSEATSLRWCHVATTTTELGECLEDALKIPRHSRLQRFLCRRCITAGFFGNASSCLAEAYHETADCCYLDLEGGLACGLGRDPQEGYRTLTDHNQALVWLVQNSATDSSTYFHFIPTWSPSFLLHPILTLPYQSIIH